MIQGPNMIIEDRVRDLLKDASIMNGTVEDWRKIRARAYSDDNLMEGTAITVAEFVSYGGTIEQVDQRVLELIATPKVLRYDTPLEWKEARSKAWTSNNLLDVAALAMAEYIRYFHHTKRIRRHMD